MVIYLVNREVFDRCVSCGVVDTLADLRRVLGAGFVAILTSGSEM